MIYDIRKVSLYFREVHSRYYVDTNGVVYTSLAPSTTRITVDGKRINISGFRSSELPNMNTTSRRIIAIPNTNKKYYLLNDGTILQRLQTMLTHNGEVKVSIINVLKNNDTGSCYLVHRLVAAAFVAEVAGKDVHHIDGNRKNNKADNLEVLTREEHMKKHKTYK